MGQYEIRQLTPPELCLRFNYFDAFFLHESGNLLLQSHRLHGAFGHSYLDPTAGWVSKLDFVRLGQHCLLLPVIYCGSWLKIMQKGHFYKFHG